ncbi:hypothetical protein M404DRAFT_699642 [Pisolithus tinctorius Marx 270]|uniref:Uncharacterized protein n=1 Tax=Pisolithus tinctorius Marx 270 TaxID=870435 RepID=A0A0C3PUF6_PISTI|nr:hypothetical protein M404DRAFT_699642 [Pisolithus tinctorius Marx 270]
MASRRNAVKASPASSSNIVITEEEQWRLVRESGVLSKVKKDQDSERSATEEPDDDGPSALVEEIFDASVFIMPMTFFLVMMEILIHRQYGKQPSFGDVAQKLLSTLPSPCCSQYVVASI